MNTFCHEIMEVTLPGVWERGDRGMYIRETRERMSKNEGNVGEKGNIWEQGI